MWQRLGDRLITLVDDGVLPDGTQLPPERAVADRLGISRTTATAAYRHAKEAGRVVARQGSGSWTRSPAGGSTGGGAFSTLGRPVAGMIDLSLAETRCDGYTRAVIEELEPTWLLAAVRGTGYHPQGLPALRAVLADHLTGHGHRVGPDDVLVTTGAQQAISLAATVLCPPSSTVLVEQASYPGALEVFRRLGVRLLPVPTDARGPDPRSLATLIARTRPALVYLVPVGNNPTGVVIPAERLDGIAEVLARTGVPVIEDRTAAPLADPAGVPAPLAARLPAGAAVVVGSMSKVAWAGVRTGWLIAPPTLRHELLAARIATDLAGSAVTQELARHLVPRLAELAARVRADLDVRQRTLDAALARWLPEWTAPAPAAGAWRWVRIPADARSFSRAALAQGVMVTPGPLFSPQGLLTDHLRIATVAEPEILTEAVSRLRRAWDGAGHAPQPAGDGRELLVI